MAIFSCGHSLERGKRLSSWTTSLSTPGYVVRKVLHHNQYITSRALNGPNLGIACQLSRVVLWNTVYGESLVQDEIKQSAF